MFAMVLQNRVIEIVNSDKEPMFPPDQFGNEIISIKCDESVKVGMIYTNGDFIEDEINEPEATQLDNIENSQLTIMEALAEQYEENLENRLNDMEVQATIYETILEIQEGI